MNRKSKKQLSIEEQTHGMRHAFIEFGVLCEKCGATYACDPHEIPAGSYRHQAIYSPFSLLFLCRPCHELLQGREPSEQIAVKTMSVLRSVNDCYGNTRVTIRDVIAELEQLTGEGE